MSHMWMSHVTHVDETCHTYGWVMSHMWMSYVTLMDESCHIYGWVVSHIWMSHVTHIDESCHTYRWVMSHISMSHVTHIWMSHVTHLHVSDIPLQNHYLHSDNHNPQKKKMFLCETFRRFSFCILWYLFFDTPKNGYLILLIWLVLSMSCIVMFYGLFSPVCVVNVCVMNVCVITWICVITRSHNE